MGKRIILVYHGIGEQDLFMEVPMKNFEEQLNYLKSQYKIVNVSALLISKNKSDLATIIFDDALLSAFPAMKYLDELGTAYDVAIIENKLSKQDCCNLEQLMSLKKAQFLFHTKSHNDLTKLEDAKLQEEISIGRYDRIKFQKGIFVYPMGLYDKKTIIFLKQRGYNFGLTVLPFHLPKHIKKPFEIPRICINGNTSIKKFKFYTSFCGNIYLHMAFIKRKMLGQNYRDG